MDQKLREKIIKSNEAVRVLQKNGFICLGITKDMKKVAVQKGDEFELFDNYLQAKEKLIE